MGPPLWALHLTPRGWGSIDTGLDKCTDSWYVYQSVKLLLPSELHSGSPPPSDIDPVFANSEEWYQAIPEEIRPDRDQPFYHLLAESDESDYVAYVSQQNLIGDSLAGPVSHPDVHQYFEQFENGRYRMRNRLTH